MNRGAPILVLVLAVVVAAFALCTASCVRTVRVPVLVEPRPCITRPFTRAPRNAAPGSPRWIAAYRKQIAEMQAAELACGIEPPAVAPEADGEPVGHYR